MKFSEGGQFENPQAGSHVARCIQLIDLGTQQHSGFQGREPWSSRDVRIIFELPGEKMLGLYKPELKDKPFGVGITVKQSLHASSKMRKLLEGWRGKKFTHEEIAAFIPSKLLGAPCRLALIENGDFINIDSISPLGKSDKCPKQINPSIYFSLDPAEFNAEVFKNFSDKLREKISKSPEYQALLNGTGEVDAGSPDDPQEEPSDNDGGPF